VAIAPELELADPATTDESRPDKEGGGDEGVGVEEDASAAVPNGVL